MSDKLVGGILMLRTAATPTECWLEGASPELFVELRRLCEQEDAALEANARLARVTHETLRCSTGLDVDSSRALSRLARRPHLAIELRAGGSSEVTVLIDEVARPIPLLSASIREATERHVGVSQLGSALTESLETELHRIRLLPLATARRSSLLEATFRRNARVVFDAELKHVDALHAVRNPKRQRQHAAVLWRLLTRSATVCTPRDLLAHVMPVDDGAAARSASDRTGDWIAFHWVEHIHGVVRDLAAQGLVLEDSEVRVSLSPLHQGRGDRLHVWRPTVEDPTAFRELSVQRSSLIDALVSTLRCGAVPTAECMAALIGAGRDVSQEERAASARLIEHLVGIGLLQLTRAPREGVCVVPAAEAAARLATLDLPVPSQAWLDVYRKPQRPATLERSHDLERAVIQVVRLARAIEPGDPEGRRPRTGKNQASGPAHTVMDLVEEHLRAIRCEASSKDPSVGAAASSMRGSDVVHWIEDGLHARSEVCFTSSTLDGLGAADASFDWPLDALIGVNGAGGAPMYTLTHLAAAGSLDSRFLPAVGRLGLSSPAAESYRQFLDAVEHLTSARFIELLVPPMTDKADNATRRPTYTSLYTGDPDDRLYLGHAGTGRYVPLSEITISQGDQVTARWKGERLLPIYHATRSALAPWDFIAGLMLNAAPRARVNHRGLMHRLAMRPGCSFRPRVSVGNTLVIAPAEWRVTEADLWPSGARLIDKAKQLTRLRSRLDLPRWVTARTSRSLVTADLESLFAIDILERAVRDAAGEIYMAEMLPDPRAASIASPLNDTSGAGAGYVLAETLVRFPIDLTVDEMARRACSSYSPAGR